MCVAGKLDAFQIRVGKESSDIGRRDAFQRYSLCFFSPVAVDTDVPGSMQCDCKPTQLGRYISIQLVDPVIISQMKLCNVDILYH